MDALGLAPTFKRQFKFVAMVGFCSIVVVAYEYTLVNFGEYEDSNSVLQVVQASQAHQEDQMSIDLRSPW